MHSGQKQEFSGPRGSKGSCFILTSQISGKGLPTELCSDLSSLAGFGGEGGLTALVVSEDAEVHDILAFSSCLFFSVTAS